MARLSIHVQPRASANAVAGWEGDAIKVRLTAPPVEGKANKALVEFLAERLRVSESAVAVITGHSARHKIVEVDGIGEAEALTRLGLPGKPS